MGFFHFSEHQFIQWAQGNYRKDFLFVGFPNISSNIKFLKDPVALHKSEALNFLTSGK